MKMNKILLTAALLVSARGFAMQPFDGIVEPTRQAVKASIIERAKTAAKLAWTNSMEFVSKGASTIKTKISGLHLPEGLKTKLASCSTWAADKGVTASNWVVKHTPALVKNALTDKRNLKLAGAAAAIATAATLWYKFGAKLVTKKAKTN